MSAAGQNLEVIQKAIVRHNGNCDGEIIEIQMNSYEIERLGWDEFRGIPIVPNDDLPNSPQPGSFRLICDRENREDALREAREEVLNAPGPGV